MFFVLMCEKNVKNNARRLRVAFDIYNEGLSFENIGCNHLFYSARSVMNRGYRTKNAQNG